MANVFNTLGQNVMPKVFGKLKQAGLTDLMDVQGETTSVGSGGGRIKSEKTTVYCKIPVTFKTKGSEGYKVIESDQMTSTQRFVLTFPSHTPNGTRYDIDPRQHRLVVRARTGEGTEPSKTFRIISIRDDMGVLYEADCVVENYE